MHRLRPRTVQMDLFGPADKGDQPLDTPPWESLPETTRRRATVLMAQLFLEHHRIGTDAERDLENDDV